MCHKPDMCMKCMCLAYGPPATMMQRWRDYFATDGDLANKRLQFVLQMSYLSIPALQCRFLSKFCAS